MKYKIKKGSILWNEYLGGLIFVKIGGHYQSTLDTILISFTYSNEFELIEEKEFTKDDMLDILIYSWKKGNSKLTCKAVLEMWLNRDHD